MLHPILCILFILYSSKYKHIHPFSCNGFEKYCMVSSPNIFTISCIDKIPLTLRHRGKFREQINGLFFLAKTLGWGSWNLCIHWIW